jgi:hypothetical protein
MRIEVHVDTLVVDGLRSIGPATQAQLADEVALALASDARLARAARESEREIADGVAAHVAAAVTADGGASRVGGTAGGGGEPARGLHPVGPPPASGFRPSQVAGARK